VPRKGTVFVSVREIDKTRIVDAVRLLFSLGFKVMATSGTQRLPGRSRRTHRKSEQGARGPAAYRRRHHEWRHSAGLQYHRRAQALADSRSLRRAALLHKVPYYTTLSVPWRPRRVSAPNLGGDLEVRTLQSYFSET